MRLLIKILLLLVIVFSSSCNSCTDGDDEETQPDTSSIKKKEDPQIIVQHQTKEERIDSILCVNISHDTTAMYELPKFTIPRPSAIDYRLTYSVSFNSETLNANWVAWSLTRQHTHGPEGDPYSRKKLNPSYYVDLDTTKAHQDRYDWNGAFPPYQHGHLCPAADNKWSEAAMHQSFFLSNMSPQDGDFNSGRWEDLEDKCRHWANTYGEIFIVTGPIFYSKDYRTLPGGKIAIPDAFFKVVMRLNPEPKAIGFILANNSEIQLLNDAAKSVDEVEQITGLDFFHLIDDKTEIMIEKSYNINDWVNLEQ